jgi:hypothetical protein
VRLHFDREAQTGNKPGILLTRSRPPETTRVQAPDTIQATTIRLEEEANTIEVYKTHKCSLGCGGMNAVADKSNRQYNVMMHQINSYIIDINKLS